MLKRQKESHFQSNVKEHQVFYLLNAQRGGARAFLLVSFSEVDKVFLLYINQFVDFVKANTRKSIPIKFFDENCPLLDNLDYYSVLKNTNV